MDLLAKKVTNWLINCKSIKESDREIYQYGVKFIITFFINLISAVTIGALFGVLVEIILFLILFIPLRSNVGGVHSKSQLTCYVLTLGLMMFIVLSIKYIYINEMFSQLIILMSGLIIFVLSPLGSENKQLDSLEKKVYKKRSIILLLINISIYLVGIILDFNILIKMVTINLGVIGFILVFSCMIKVLKIGGEKCRLKRK